MRRRGAKCWCARDGTGAWRSNTVVARCAGERSSRPQSLRFSIHRSARRVRACRFQSRNGSGGRRKTIRGIKRSAARCRSAPPSWPPPRRARRWPGPPLRPKRSALRATQGCAPDQASKTERCRRSSEMGIVVPGASWRELFRGKPPRKEKQAEQKKGTFLTR